MKVVADVNAVLDKYNHTLLHCATISGNIEAMHVLLAKGAGINAQDENGRTPLHYAAVSGNLEVVNALLKAGAYVNAKDKNDKTPLDLAGEEGHKNIVDALLAAGAVEMEKVLEEEVERAAIAAIKAKIIMEAAEIEAKIDSRLMHTNITSAAAQTALVK